MLAIVVQVEPPLVEYSHLITLPVLPVKLSVPLLVPEQTVALEFTVPPTETGFTVIVTELEFADVQTPLCTTALYWVVRVILEYVCEVVVLAIVVQVEPPLVEYSHLITLPVLPVKLSVPLLVPEQTVAPEFTVPPTETGFTVIVTELEFADVHTPLYTARV